ncbi:MAG: CerR family C-terminal domain-containing protein [Tepidisphaeraceae bacterium]
MANVKNNASAKETKRRLIDSAGAVFAQHGFERATIKEITDRAGASVAAVNYHFSDKQELYDHVVNHIHESGCAVLRAIVDLPTDAPPERRLHEFITRFLTHILDPQQPEWFCQIKAREMQNPSETTTRYLETTLKPFVRQVEALIASLLPGPVPPLELTRLTDSVVGQVLFYAQNRSFSERLHPDHPKPAEVVGEIADHITQFTLAALSCWGRDKT